MTPEQHLRLARTTTSPTLRAKHFRLFNEADCRRSIEACVRCPLSETRTKAVPWSGPTSAQVVFVGEAPGANEDAAGVPFVGQAGRLLDRVLEGAGTSRDEVMVMNTVNCRPPSNRTPTNDETLACEDHRRRQLDLSDAIVLATLGKTAYQTVTGEEGQVRMNQVRGVPRWVEGFILVPTWHPAYVLRNRDVKFQFEADVALAVRMAQQGRHWPTCREPNDCVPEWTDEQKTRFRERGWVVVKAHTMGGELVTVVRDKSVRVGAKRSERLARDLPRFTVEELVKVREIGRRRGRGVAKGSLQALLWVKKELGGTVIL